MVRDVYIKVAEADCDLQIIKCYDADNVILTPDEIFHLIIDKLKEKNILR
jgi:hypothetical protein